MNTILCLKPLFGFSESKTLGPSFYLLLLSINFSSSYKRIQMEIIQSRIKLHVYTEHKVRELIMTKVKGETKSKTLYILFKSLIQRSM